MTRKYHIRTLLAAASLAALGLSQSAAATSVPCATGPTPSNVMSCSAGVYVDVLDSNGVSAQVGPVANAFGTAPTPYNKSQGLANAAVTFDFTSNFLVAALRVQTGIITDTARSPFNGSLGTVFATATSTVDGLNISLIVPSVKAGVVTVHPAVTLLAIRATTVASTSTAQKFASGKILNAVGTSEIENLSISGLGLNTITNVNVLATASPNDFLVSTGTLDIIANYQTPIFINGLDRIGIQTAALAIRFNEFVLGNNLLNGTILVGDTAASVPESTTWAMMILGLGLIGVAARRRQTFAMA